MTALNKSRDEFAIFEVILSDSNNSIPKDKASNESKPKAKQKTKPKAKAKENESDDVSKNKDSKSDDNAPKIKESHSNSENDDKNNSSEDDKSKPQPKAKAKPKDKPKAKTKAKENDVDTSKNAYKMCKECINDLKKMYAVLKHIQNTCIETLNKDNRYASCNAFDLIKISKEDKVTFMNKIGAILFNLLNLSINGVDNNFDISIDYNMINICLNFIGRYSYNNDVPINQIINKHIDENFVKRNANIYSVHADVLYVNKNIHIFKGIIVVFNNIIENNYINNSDKNKNITVSMFINVMKEVYLKQFKYTCESTIIECDDDMHKYYDQMKKLLMDKTFTGKITAKFNEI
tara:strand:- start:149 stop:1192 length:1044 start_codon:yes stop_codon:yes gene_type:complete